MSNPISKALPTFVDANLASQTIIKVPAQNSPLLEIARTAITKTEQIPPHTTFPIEAVPFLNIVAQTQKIVAQTQKAIDKTILRRTIEDVLLGIAILVSSAASIILFPLGICATVLLFESNQNFQVQANREKRKLQEIPTKWRENFSAPLLLEAQEVFEQLPLQTYQESTQAQIRDDYTSEPDKSGLLTQFANDIKREYSFTIADTLVNYETPRPSPLLQSNEKIQDAINGLEPLKNTDPEWHRAIQATCNQTILNFSIGIYRGACNIAALSHPWKEEARSFNLQLDFHDKEKVIGMTISRDDKGKIEKIDFATSVSFDFIKVNTDNNPIPNQLFLENVVKGQVTFSLTLDEEKQPIISHYNVTLT